MDRWWHDTDRSKPQSHCHFAHNIFHIDCSGLNPRFRGENLATNSLSHCCHESRCEKCFCLRGRPEIFGRPGECNNLAPLLIMFFKICYLRDVRRIFMRARVQIENNSRINSYACRKLSLLEPLLKLCQWCLSAPYRWAPAAAARLVRPFVQPWSSGLWRRVSI
jgi:hypothetical protein